MSIVLKYIPTVPESRPICADALISSFSVYNSTLSVVGSLIGLRDTTSLLLATVERNCWATSTSVISFFSCMIECYAYKRKTFKLHITQFYTMSDFNQHTQVYCNGQQGVVESDNEEWECIIKSASLSTTPPIWVVPLLYSCALRQCIAKWTHTN